MTGQTTTEAAFFDLDKTIIAGSSTLAFGRPLYRAGFLPRRTLLRIGIASVSYMLFGADEDSLERARDGMLDLVSGWRKAEVESLISETLTEIIEPIVFAEALFLIDEHKRAGREVYVVSASPEEFVTPIARMVPIDGDRHYLQYRNDLLVDPNYKSQFKKQTGRELRIEHPLELSLGRLSTLEAGGIHLANAGWADTPYMIRAAIESAFSSLHWLRVAHQCRLRRDSPDFSDPAGTT